MKAVVLDASDLADDPRRERPPTRSTDALAGAGAGVERIVVRDLDMRPCTGCFGCWTRTPGECVIDDDARSVAERVIAADVYAVVTPVSFGSFGSLAKSVLDRLICLVLPHFTMVDGEVHHRPRYRAIPRGARARNDAAPDAEQAALFARLVERNAVNLHNPTHAAETVAGDESPRRSRRAAARDGGDSTGGAWRERARTDAVCLLLVGSPKPKGGASAAFACRLSVAARGAGLGRLVPSE